MGSKVGLGPTVRSRWTGAPLDQFGSAVQSSSNLPHCTGAVQRVQTPLGGSATLPLDLASSRSSAPRLLDRPTVKTEFKIVSLDHPPLDQTRLYRLVANEKRVQGRAQPGPWKQSQLSAELARWQVKGQEKHMRELWLTNSPKKVLCTAEDYLLLRQFDWHIERGFTVTRIEEQRGASKFTSVVSMGAIMLIASKARQSALETAV